MLGQIGRDSVRRSASSLADCVDRLRPLVSQVLADRTFFPFYVPLTFLLLRQYRTGARWYRECGGECDRRSGLQRGLYRFRRPHYL